MDTQKHISSAFDQDLTILNDSLQQLGDLACQQFEGAIEGLAMQNQANLDKVIKAMPRLMRLRPKSMKRRLRSLQSARRVPRICAMFWWR